MRKIDINCDVGEGVGNEGLLMPLLSSCNISCGAHAGSVEIIDEVLVLAKKFKVKVGAHPSYPDRRNFGRKVLDIPNDELKLSLIDQLKLFRERAELQGVEIHHVKPHGALYNKAAIDESTANVVLDSVKSVFGNMKLYAPFQSVIAKLAKKYQIPVVYEGFADRNYDDDLKLIPRSHLNAVLTEPKDVIPHVSRMVNGKVQTLSGKERTIKVETFCVHGDNERAFEILKELNHHFGVD